jgi:hypothetical protein
VRQLGEMKAVPSRDRRDIGDGLSIERGSQRVVLGYEKVWKEAVEG